MRKSTLFISAVLTTFVMAMLAGVASAYQNVVKTEEVTVEQQLQPQIQTISNALPEAAPTEQINWTPEQAAELAAQVMGQDDLFSVEVTEWNSESVYLVTFSSGDLVYISLDGQVRSIGKLEVETVIINSKNNNGGNNNNTSQVSRRNESEDHEQEDHEEHEEHEEEHDD